MFSCATLQARQHDRASLFSQGIFSPFLAPFADQEPLTLKFAQIIMQAWVESRLFKEGAEHYRQGKA